MIYLAVTSTDLDPVLAVPGVDDAQPLTEAVLLIDAQLTRSQLYHRLKAIQPAGDPLLVAALLEVPKFKGMAPGALAWARDRLATGDA